MPGGIVPFTGSDCNEFVIFGYMVITVPVGLFFFALMMRGSKESYENTVVKTKALNDTAVEYINGIEVIKAFGKAKTSYEKFVIAAHEPPGWL